MLRSPFGGRVGHVCELSVQPLSGIAGQTERKGKPVQTHPMPVAFDAVPRPGSDEDRAIARQIHAGLRADILSLALPPHTQLSEGETGARFGASRTPVREAMTWLRDEGLIVTQPSRGNFVTTLSEDAIRAALFVSEALEVACALRICATGLAPEDDARLGAALTAQRNALSFGDIAAFHVADDAFHAAIAGATGLPRVRTLILREKTALDRLRALQGADMERLGELEGDHRRILNCLRKGRVDRLQRIVPMHLARSLDALEDLRTCHAEYFA